MLRSISSSEVVLTVAQRRPQRREVNFAEPHMKTLIHRGGVARVAARLNHLFEVPHV